MPDERKIFEVEAIHRRAVLKPDSLDEKSRTIEVVFATDTPVLMRDWEIGPFYEVLSFEQGCVRMERINNGAPVLDMHHAYSVKEDVLGVVENGTAKIEGNQLSAKLRFSRRPDIEPVFNDIKDRILQNISSGYRVFKYEKMPTTEKEEIPTYKAIDWEPFEITIAIVQADINSKIRTNSDKNKVEFTNNSRLMPEEVIIPAEGTEGNKAGAGAPETGAAEGSESGNEGKPAPGTENEQERAIKVERTRVMDIRTAVRTAKLPDEFADNLIKDGTSTDQARKLIIEEFAKGDPHAGSRGNIQLTGPSEGDKKRTFMEESLLHRANPTANPLDKMADPAREYRHFSLLDLAKERLEEAGVRTRAISKHEIVTRALASTDYPLLLGNVVHKILRRAYDAPPQTWKPLARQVNASDFKTMQAIQFGGNISLQEVPEGGEFKSGKLAESAESWKVKTYGKIVNITRQAIINDDLNGFSRLAELFGIAAANLESDIMWALINNNPAMADTKALFHTGHANLKGANGAAPDIAGLSAARLAIGKQTGLDGEKLNLQAKYLMVPLELQTVAEQLISPAFMPTTQSNINPFQSKLQIISDPRLTDAYAWYMAADPGMIDILVYSYLEGSNGLYTETRYGFEVDGIQVKVRKEFGGTVLDHRGLYKNKGAV